MTSHLRDATRPAPVPYESRLHFAGPGGMYAAADRCLNIGLCRKTSAGVMCPSYMATREEEHSTRGRANALVKALSEPSPRDALADPRLHDILDLCLQCKACKTECPLGVDMAALKTEALAAYHDRHGVPLRSRMFGAIRMLNRLGSATAPLANLVIRSTSTRYLTERWLGITSARPLPHFQHQTLIHSHAHRPRPVPSAAPRGELVFLADSFTTFTEPAVGRAAIHLLERAGWAVRLEAGGCCGRAALSKGLIGRARTQARDLVDRLAGSVGRGALIVGAEPSCIFMLKDECQTLLGDDPRIDKLAAAVRLPEELLAAAIADGTLSVPETSPLSGARILFHGHCHQKAASGTAATLALLRAVPGAEVTEVDAGCCGMAGSFGFEAEHYQLSMRIGSLRLFPAVVQQPAATIIAASGVSCRQQIEHGTGREARHPLQIAWEALAPPQDEAVRRHDTERSQRSEPSG